MLQWGSSSVVDEGPAGDGQAYIHLRQAYIHLRQAYIHPRLIQGGTTAAMQPRRALCRRHWLYFRSHSGHQAILPCRRHQAHRGAAADRAAAAATHPHLLAHLPRPVWPRAAGGRGGIVLRAWHQWWALGQDRPRVVPPPAAAFKARAGGISCAAVSCCSAGHTMLPCSNSHS